MATSVIITLTSNSQDDNGIAIPVEKVADYPVSQLARIYMDLSNIKITRGTFMSLSQEQKTFLDIVSSLNSRYYTGSLVEVQISDYKLLRNTVDHHVTMNHAVALLDDLIVVLITEQSKDNYRKLLETKKSSIVAENSRIPLLPLVEKLQTLANDFDSVSPEQYDHTRKKQYKLYKQSAPLLWGLFWKTIEDMHSLRTTSSPELEHKDFRFVKKRLDFLHDELSKMLTFPEKEKQQ